MPAQVFTLEENGFLSFRINYSRCLICCFFLALVLIRDREEIVGSYRSMDTGLISIQCSTEVRLPSPIKIPKVYLYQLFITYVNKSALCKIVHEGIFVCSNGEEILAQLLPLKKQLPSPITVDMFVAVIAILPEEFTILQVSCVHIEVSIE